MGLKLIGEIAMDGSGWEAGLNKLMHGTTHSLRRFALEAFGVFSVHQAFQKTIDSAHELVATSKRLAVGVEELQLMRQAAKDNNAEFGVMVSALEKVNQARDKALSHSKRGDFLLERFGKLGVDLEDLKNKGGAELLMGPIRSSLLKGNPQELGPVLKDILGKSFGQAVPVLMEDFDELRHKMQRLGALMSTESAVQLNFFANQLELGSQILVSQFAPALVAATWAILKFSGKVAAGLEYILNRGGGTAGGVLKYVTGTQWAEYQNAKAMMDFRRQNPKYADAAADAAAQAIIDKYEATKDKSDLKYDETTRDLENKLKDLEATLKAEAGKLKKPAPPIFEEAPPGKPKPNKGMPPAEDALVRVGNFLGTSRNALSDIAERQLQVLREIADNTRKRTREGGDTLTEDDFP